MILLRKPYAGFRLRKRQSSIAWKLNRKPVQNTVQRRIVRARPQDPGVLNRANIQNILSPGFSLLAGKIYVLARPLLLRVLQTVAWSRSFYLGKILAGNVCFFQWEWSSFAMSPGKYVNRLYMAGKHAWRTRGGEKYLTGRDDRRRVDRLTILCLCGEVCINKGRFRRMAGQWRDMLQVDLLCYIFQLCCLTAVHRFGSTWGVSLISPANSRSTLTVSGEIKVSPFQCICSEGFWRASIVLSQYSRF